MPSSSIEGLQRIEDEAQVKEAKHRELRAKPETRAKLEKKRRRDPPQKNRT